MPNTKPITEIEPGQRYSETYDPDEVYTLVSLIDSRDPEWTWIEYRDADNIVQRGIARKSMHVFPVGPAPSVVKAAVAQLQAEFDQPQVQAAIGRILADG